MERARPSVAVRIEIVAPLTPKQFGCCSFSEKETVPSPRRFFGKETAICCRGNGSCWRGEFGKHEGVEGSPNAVKKKQIEKATPLTARYPRQRRSPPRRHSRSW